MQNKVTWKRLEKTIEPAMYEKVGENYKWVNYRQSKCYNPKYQPFFKDESKGMDAFRTALKLGYIVVKSEEV
jgi:hypothetical protein